MLKKLIELFKQEANKDLMSKLEAESQERAARNAERIAKIKQEMGDKYILADCHKRGKLKEPRPV